MAAPFLYEGPSRTLFILEKRTLRILTYDGQEAVVAVEDLIALLLHLSAHRVAAFSALKDYQYRRLAVTLRRRISEAHG